MPDTDTDTTPKRIQLSDSTAIEIPNALYERLDEMPYGAVGRYARERLERAINRALDAAGWPDGPRGAWPIKITYWYVNITNPDGTFRGHVGPITSIERADKVAESWRKIRHRAEYSHQALGRALTEPGLVL